MHTSSACNSIRRTTVGMFKCSGRICWRCGTMGEVATKLHGTTTPSSLLGGGGISKHRHSGARNTRPGFKVAYLLSSRPRPQRASNHPNYALLGLRASPQFHPSYTNATRWVWQSRRRASARRPREAQGRPGRPRETQRSAQKPRTAQGGPGRPREAQGAPGRPGEPKEAQEGPEKPRKAQGSPGSPGKPREAQGGPGGPKEALRSFETASLLEKRFRVLILYVSTTRA